MALGDRHDALLAALADGQFHSGQALGRALGMTRAAVWKLVQGLESLGLEVHAVRGRGYRLAVPLELLDAERILAALGSGARGRLARLELHRRIDSTNAHLLARARAGESGVVACLAEWQGAGRGRRGRSWFSPFGSNLYLSLLWPFRQMPPGLSGLSLVAGVAVVRALRAIGGAEVGLKWPNDVLWHERKLAGLLLEFHGEGVGPCQVVCGVGLNLAMPAGAPVDQPWADLRQVLGRDPERNAIAARVLQELLAAFTRFEAEGLGPALEEWAAYDVTAGREVSLLLADRTLRGVARGVDSDGALLLDDGAGVRRYHAGEVSLRMLR